MDDGVLQAQRTYGAFLASSPVEREQRRALARERYDQVVARAAQGHPDAQTEVARIIGNPKPPPVLGLGPGWFSPAVPIEWLEPLIGRRRWSAPEMAQLLQVITDRRLEVGPIAWRI